MPRIPSTTERELRDLKPRGLDEDFLARLTACAEGSMLDLTDEELAFENSLRAIRPAAAPRALRSSLESAVEGTPFAVDDKIVLFHGTSRGESRPVPSRFSRFNLAAAAAVALLGSIAALMLPETGGITENTAAKPERTPPSIAPVSENFAPASYNRNLSDTRDEGVIWNGGNSPHRVLRFTFTDRFVLRNPEGETLEVEQPREELFIIPEKID